MCYSGDMKQFGLRYLYKHLGRVIKDIPFEITNHNRVVGVVVKPEDVKPKVYKKDKDERRSNS